MGHWTTRVGCGLLLIVLATLGAGCRRSESAMTELQRIRSGNVDVVLLSGHDALRHGKDMFTIEFRSTSDGSLVDVGNVRTTANMPMPGMPMFGTIEVKRTDVPGRYTATSDFSMAGSWRMNISWDMPAGSIGFAGTVQ